MGAKKGLGACPGTDCWYCANATSDSCVWVGKGESEEGVKAPVCEHGLHSVLHCEQGQCNPTPAQKLRATLEKEDCRKRKTG